MKISSQTYSYVELQLMTREACREAGLRYEDGAKPHDENSRRQWINILLRPVDDRFRKMSMPTPWDEFKKQHRIGSVCWFGFISFFDLIFKLAKEREGDIHIQSRGLTEYLCGNKSATIKGHEHWHEIKWNLELHGDNENVGSVMYPLTESSRCHCYCKEEHRCCSARDEFEDKKNTGFFEETASKDKESV